MIADFGLIVSREDLLISVICDSQHFLSSLSWLIWHNQSIRKGSVEDLWVGMVLLFILFGKGKRRVEKVRSMTFFHVVKILSLSFSVLSS